MTSNIIKNDKDEAGITHHPAFIIFTIIQISMGLLFAITGISKLLILRTFTETIRQVLPMTGSGSEIVALFIICIELLCGVCLLADKYIRACAVTLGILTISFIYILSIAIVSQHTFTCHCFGIIPLSLSNSHELVINFIIFDLLVLVYMRTIHTSPHNSIGRKISIVVGSLIVLYGQATAALFIIDRDVSDTPINLMRINNFLSTQERYMEGRQLGRHIVLIRISDFNCPPCFEDFIGYVELMHQYFDTTRDKYRIIGLVEKAGAFNDPMTLHAWGIANSIDFPLVLVPDTVFQEFGFTNSCVVFQQPFGRIRMVYTFPDKHSAQKKLLSAFEN